jgi:hypothetical protein
MRPMLRVLSLVLVLGCRDRSSPEHSAEPTPTVVRRDGGVPITPPHPAMISIRGGRFLGREHWCLEGTLTVRYPGKIYATDPVPLKVAAFRIDRAPTTCEDWERCVKAGFCTPYDHGKLYCQDGIATVLQESAKQYCKWRQARLPTYAEWQRAARSTDGRMFPMGDEWKDVCPDRNITHPCKFVSPDGLEYWRNTPAELTGDTDCRASLSPSTSKIYPLRIVLVGDRINEMVAGDWPGNFRCALDGLEPTQP